MPTYHYPLHIENLEDFPRDLQGVLEDQHVNSASMCAEDWEGIHENLSSVCDEESVEYFPQLLHVQLGDNVQSMEGSSKNASPKMKTMVHTIYSQIVRRLKNLVTTGSDKHMQDGKHVKSCPSAASKDEAVTCRVTPLCSDSKRGKVKLR